MKVLVVVLCLFTVRPSFAKSLDRARTLAAKIEVLLPAGTKLLCENCDDVWIEGGQAVANLEQVLENLTKDLRLYTLDSPEKLGRLLAEHIALVLNQHTDDRVSTSAQDGKHSLCALSHEPCELFRRELFAKFCSVDGEI